MPVAAAVAPLAGLATSVIGGITGATNARPPSLSPQQSQALNTQLQQDQSIANGPAKIDPTQQSALFQQNAQQQTAANDALGHNLAARGLDRSGLLAQGLINNQAQSSANQTGINLGLQQQAIQQQNFNKQLTNQLIGIKDTPGQSTAGGFFAGAAPNANYAIQSAANNYTPGGNQVPQAPAGSTGAVNNNTINSGVWGAVPFVGAVPPNPQVSTS